MKALSDESLRLNGNICEQVKFVSDCHNGVHWLHWSNFTSMTTKSSAARACWKAGFNSSDRVIRTPTIEFGEARQVGDKKLGADDAACQGKTSLEVPLERRRAEHYWMRYSAISAKTLVPPLVRDDRCDASGAYPSGQRGWL